MPHILLETTADLPENANIPDILDVLVERLGSFESISKSSIKAYHTLRSVWSVGDGHPPGFAHCCVSILEGRSPELQARISAGMYDVLKAQFTQSLHNSEVGLTLELREMQKDTYMK